MCSGDDEDYVESNPYEDEMIRQADSMWKDYQEKYVPLEGQVMDRTAGYNSAAYKQSSVNKAANAARLASPGTVLAGPGMQPGGGNFVTSAATGANQSGAATGMGAMGGLQTAKDSYLGGGMNLAQVGRKQQATSMAGYGTLSSLKAGQQAAEREAKQTITNAKMGALGSVAGAATAYGVKEYGLPGLDKNQMETATNVSISREDPYKLSPHRSMPTPGVYPSRIRS